MGSDFLYGGFGAAGAALVGGAFTAASGSVVVGTLVGGPIGTVLGLAVAQALVQIANPGERGAFTLLDAAEAATPFYTAPPEPGKLGPHDAGSGDGAALGPAGAAGATACGCGALPGAGVGVRFSAWGASGVGGAIGGGFGGF